MELKNGQIWESGTTRKIIGIVGNVVTHRQEGGKINRASTRNPSGSLVLYFEYFYPQLTSESRSLSHRLSASIIRIANIRPIASSDRINPVPVSCLIRSIYFSFLAKFNGSIRDRDQRRTKKGNFQKSPHAYVDTWTNQSFRKLIRPFLNIFLVELN